MPTFPRAKYVFHQRECEAWEAADARGENPPGNVWRFNCWPVVEAGQALLVEDGFELDDGVWLTPGHSPHHCCVNIRSGGMRAVVTGDMMHHALQCREPDRSTVFDWVGQWRRARGGRFSTRLLILILCCSRCIFRRRPQEGWRRMRHGFGTGLQFSERRFWHLDRFIHAVDAGCRAAAFRHAWHLTECHPSGGAHLAGTQ